NPYVSVLRSSFEPLEAATACSSWSMSCSACVNSPAESGLKMTAPTPAGVSEHSVCSVTAAVEMANSRSPAGAFSFFRPKRMSVRPKRLLLRRRGGLRVACADLLGRGVARAHFRLQLRQLAVDLRRRGDLRQLAVELRLVASGEVLERARARQLVDRRRARLQLLGLVACALDGRAGVGHAAADSRCRLADAHLGLGGRVLRLQHFLLGPERLDARLELLLRRDELVLLVGEPLHLGVEVLQLLLRHGLALERGAGEILPVRGNRLAGLRLELHDVL